MNQPINYYQDMSSDPRGLFYRLDGADVVTGVIDRLKGGFVIEGALKVYRDENRMMNDEGCRRVEFFLSGAVNKIAHLTKFSNETRVMMQIKELSRAFLIELVKNMKVWAPDARQEVKTTEKEIVLPNGETTITTITERFIINPSYDKVRNPEMVLQVVENAMLLSYQRGEGGFEAVNLGKSWQVTENIGKEHEDETTSRFARLFGRRPPNG